MKLPPTVVGQIQGFEIAAQGDGHGAIFVFSFSGTVNGKKAKGSGWIEVFHDPLPTSSEPEADITGGDGGVLIGLLPLDIDVLGGQLTFVQPGVFHVVADLKMGNRLLGFRPATFNGALSHLTFPPTIGGAIMP